MADKDTIARITDNLTSRDLLEARSLYIMAAEAIEGQGNKSDYYFNFISAIAAVYRLGIDSGKRQEREKKKA